MGRDGSLNVSGERKERNGKRERRRRVTYGWWFHFLLLSVSISLHTCLFLCPDPNISFVASHFCLLQLISFLAHTLPL